jgi:hypothetical protein
VNAVPQSPESDLLKLKKRLSPSDYWDGYLAGLKTAADAILRFIDLAEQAKHISEHVNQIDDELR